MTTMEHAATRQQAARAVADAFRKLAPREQAKNPVMLMVYVSAILTLELFVLSLFGISDTPSGFTLAISVILWCTVLFANFAEALAESRGKAQADALRAAKRDVVAHKFNEGLVAKGSHVDDPAGFFLAQAEEVNSVALKKKDLFFVRAEEQIPADGEIVDGCRLGGRKRHHRASRPRSSARLAATAAPLPAAPPCFPTGWWCGLPADAGDSFLDQMIAMVEGGCPQEDARTKSRSQILLVALIASCSSSFRYRCSLFSDFSAIQQGALNPTSVTSLVALARVPGAHHHRRAALRHRHCRHEPPQPARTCWP